MGREWVTSRHHEGLGDLEKYGGQATISFSMRLLPWLDLHIGAVSGADVCRALHLHQGDRALSDTF